MYFSQKMQIEKNYSIALYHLMSALGYVMCIVGAVLADGYLGKYANILYFSVLSIVGVGITTVASAWYSPPLVIIGMILATMGNGAIRACVSTLGGDQFKLPEQSEALTKFFACYYTTTYVGFACAALISPILRNDVHCFGANDCFPLAFGVSFVSMFFAITILSCGSYRVKIHGNIIWRIIKCICVRSHLINLTLH